MKKSNLSKADLRQQAEAKLNELKKRTGPLPSTDADTRRLVHELQVNQIELEMQNEELIQARAESEAVQRQYADLYDFAPVGYFTLAQDGTIRKVNLAGATLLGVEYGKLLTRRFGLFVSPKSRPIFAAFLEKVFIADGEKETCEVELLCRSKTESFWAQIEAVSDAARVACRAVVMDISERKQAEEALRESELKYRSLIEASSDAIFCVNEKGQYQFTNQLFASTFGKPPDYFIGKTFWDIYPKEHADYRFEATTRVFQTGESESLEVEVPLPDKTLFFYATANPIKDETGKVILVLTNAVNITARKQAEEDLRASEQLHRTILETAMDGFWLVDMQGSLLEVNETYCRMSGYTEQELLSMRIPDLESIEATTDTASHIQKIIEQGEDRFESRHRRKDGSFFEVEISVQYRAEEGGRFVAFLQDITARKQAEEALRESESRLKFSQQVAHVGHWTWDTVTNQVTWSDEMYRIFGLDPAAFDDDLEKVIAQAIHPDDREKVNQSNAAVVIEQKPVPLEYRVIWPDRSVHNVWAEAGEKVFGADGKILRLSGIVQDITERKRAEQALEALNIELQATFAREQQLARTDVGTGINNRRYLFELAEHEFDVATRYQQPLSAIMFDIDHFKQVNDTFGHALGDQILQRVTQVACAELRSADVIGRYGGEEFVIVLPMTNAQDAHSLAERIRASVAAIRIPTEKGQASVTLSLGIAEMIHGTQIRSAEELIRRADQAMYAAKQAGRNCTVISD